MRLVFDGVFNHTGRAHPWFKALQEGGPSSSAAARYASVRPGRSPFGDDFSYEGWNGCYDLAKLNLLDGPTSQAILEAALSWIGDYGIDGIRLDAADCLDPIFLSELGAACRRQNKDFWLMGEVVGGDYRKWLDARASDGERLLDSVTNYECYKGLWSSFVDANLFEIAWSLKRQFGDTGIYRGRALYSFADNHDVDRVASKLPREAQLYPLYCLLFTMPGIPSVYYGSERGAKAKKVPGSDWPLRPSMGEALASGSQPDLEKTISRLAALRSSLGALRRGDYRELAVASESLAFERRTERGDRVIVALNASSRPAALTLRPEGSCPRWKDGLDGGARFESRGGELRIEVPPTWARILGPA
jgi:Glycosidases